MKKLYLLLFAFSFFGMDAQNIVFADPDFKAALIDMNGVDTDSDGEITVSEASQAQLLYLNGLDISNLSGLEYFTNVSVFEMAQTSVTSLNLNFMPSLMDVNISGNPVLTTLSISGDTTMNRINVNGNASLQNLALSDVQNVQSYEVNIVSNVVLTSIDFSTLELVNDVTIQNNPLLNNLNLSNLEESNGLAFSIIGNTSLTSLDLSGSAFTDLIVTGNGLTSINLDGTFVASMNLSNNQLTNIDLSNFSMGTSFIGMLDLSGNDFTEIDLTGPWSNIEPENPVSFNPSLRLNNTQLTNISFEQPVKLSQLIIQNNTALQTLSFRNNKFETCLAGYCSIDFFDISNNPALAFVCTDPFEVYSLNLENYVSGTDWIHDIIGPNIVVSENCEFDPAGDYNTVTGIVRYDLLGNGCSASNTPVSNIAVITNGYQTNSFTGTSGNFISFTTNLQMTLSPVLNPAYFTVTPSSQTTNFTALGQNQTVNFCVAPNGTHNDLAMDVIPVEGAIAGFNTTYKVVYRNQGTTTQSGTVTAAFGNDQEFVNASVAPTSQSVGNIVWNFTDLLPFESRSIDVTLNVNGPTDNPPINSGNIISMSAWVTGAADETLSDNTDNAVKNVLNSFDPNDKQVSQGVVTLLGQTFTDGLTYTVRFQNTGTAPAQRVVITDVIDSEFDLTTIQPIASSHALTMRRTGNLLEFWFENINLPTETANEPASHGFVTYSVKSTQSYDMGFVYENTANIYFDFNLPIVTNTTSTDVIQLGAPDFAKSHFTFYPNPATTSVNILSKNGESFKAEVYNLFGQLLIRSEKSETHNIDVSGLSSGTYLVTLISDKGKETHKLIRL